MTDSLFIITLTILFLVYGFGMILGGPALATRWCHRIYQVVIVTPLRWVWRQIRRDIWWLTRWGNRQIRRFLTYLRRQVIRGIRWAWARLAWRGQMLVGVVVMIVLFVALWFVSNRAADLAISQLRSIPLYYLWWGLGTTVAVTLGIWLFRSGRAGYARVSVGAGRIGAGWILWPVVVLVAVVVGAGVVRYFYTRPVPPLANTIADTTFTVVARQGQPAEGVMPVGWRMDWWGDPTKFDSQVVWRGRNKVRLFTTKAGVDATELKLRIYPCSTEALC